MDPVALESLFAAAIVSVTVQQLEKRHSDITSPKMQPDMHSSETTPSTIQVGPVTVRVTYPRNNSGSMLKGDKVLLACSR